MGLLAPQRNFLTALVARNRLLDWHLRPAFDWSEHFDNSEHLAEIASFALAQDESIVKV